MTNCTMTSSSPAPPTESQTSGNPCPSIIAKRLILYVILTGSLLIVLLTAVIGYHRYLREIKALTIRFDEVEQGYLDVIRTALWVDDQDTLRSTLMGISKLPGIRYTRIHTPDGMLCEAGIKPDTESPMTKFYPITYIYNDDVFELGELHVQAGAHFLRNQILESVTAVLITQACTVASVCIVLLILIYRIVIKRLLMITDYTLSLSPDSLDTPFSMAKFHSHGDELDDLSHAVDHMRGNMHHAFTRQKMVEEQLDQHRQNLEHIVAERTLTLEQANEKLQMEIVERKKIEGEREALIIDLKDALKQVKHLSGMLPICSHCKKIRDDKGYWNQVEAYITQHSEAEFSHGLCPECLKIHYPEFL